MTVKASHHGDDHLSILVRSALWLNIADFTKPILRGAHDHSCDPLALEKMQRFAREDFTAASELWDGTGG